MTLNLGTAAYMAPELSSLTKWVEKFGTDEQTDVLEDSRMDHQEKENVLADNQIEAINSFDLSVSPKSSWKSSRGSYRAEDAVRTSRDLASKVRNSLTQATLT